MPENGSVIVEPKNLSLPETILLPIYNAVSDELPAWGTMSLMRDRLLREFWPTEPILASAMFSTISRYAAFGWTLDGPIRTANRFRDVLHNSELGEGWMPLIIKTLLDLFTQDNGAFIEVVRLSTGAVIQLNHLDAARCIRTGRHAEPVIYTDLNGKNHTLKKDEVIVLSEFPSPNEIKRGMQYCVVTRLLRAAQILRDIEIYKREKVSGRFTRGVHIISGVSRHAVEDAMKQKSEESDTEGLIRYGLPVIVSSVDPTANVTSAYLELAGLPDGFDEETTMRWYINQLAMAYGGDYQDYAPLPGGNLGTAQQSQVLHLKGRGKGPALFMRTLEQRFNYHGVMPNNISFSFGDIDMAEDKEREQIKLVRAQRLKILVEQKIITSDIALQMLVDSGDIHEDYLEAMGKQNITPTIRIGSSTR